MSAGSKRGDTEREGTGTIKRVSRRKKDYEPDPVAPKRGPRSGRKQGKGTSELESPTKFPVPIEEQSNRRHERVQFIDDATHKSIMQLLRKTESAEPIVHL